MSAKFYSKENLRFVLHDVINVAQLCKHSYFSQHTSDGFDMLIDSADTLATQHLRPILVDMDRNPPRIENGRVKVHKDMNRLMKKFGEDGWISLSAPEEFGGQQLPFTVLQATAFIFASANYGAMAYPFLTNGAAHLIESFGSAELKQTYIPNMYAGLWQGTMAMTEPGAGSSLSDMVSTATDTGNGYYLLKGQKIFISCGDHDGCENIVHLMLARIEDAPAGTKGISLFVVPRLRPNGNGGLEFNDVNTAGLFHKMGYHGAPIAHLTMGENNNCRAYLVGEPHRGLNYMFQMMNEARIGVGLQATSISSAAYYNALEYAHVRLQGRKPGEKDPLKPQVPIIEHADVKRMLLFQKAIVEGSLALGMHTCMYYDNSKTLEGEEREENFLKLELLTPVMKSYPAEMSIPSTSAALQCFGGYGFTKEFMAELFFRETRIHTLHEGTTAIHGMDLLGRKMILQNGKASMLLMQEVFADIEKAKQFESLQPYAETLSQKLLQLQELTMKLMGRAQKEGAEVFLSDATLFLELFSILVISWQWLKMGTKAEELKTMGSMKYTSEFLASKIYTLQYFFEYEVPKTEGLFTRLKSKNRVTVNATASEIV